MVFVFNFSYYFLYFCLISLIFVYYFVFDFQSNRGLSLHNAAKFFEHRDIEIIDISNQNAAPSNHEITTNQGKGDNSDSTSLAKRSNSVPGTTVSGKSSVGRLILGEINTDDPGRANVSLTYRAKLVEYTHIYIILITTVLFQWYMYSFKK